MDPKGNTDRVFNTKSNTSYGGPKGQYRQSLQYQVKHFLRWPQRAILTESSIPSQTLPIRWPQRAIPTESSIPSPTLPTVDPKGNTDRVFNTKSNTSYGGPKGQYRQSLQYQVKHFLRWPQRAILTESSIPSQTLPIRWPQRAIPRESSIPSPTLPTMAAKGNSARVFNTKSNTSYGGPKGQYRQSLQYQVKHFLRRPQRAIPTESSIPSQTLPTVAPKGNTDRVFNTKSNTSYGGPKGQYRQSLQYQVKHFLRWPQREIPTESSIPSPTLPTVAPKANTDRVFNVKSNTSYGGRKGQYRQSLQYQVKHFLRWPQRAIPTESSIPSPTLPTVAPKGNTDRVFNTKSNTSYGGPKGKFRQSLQYQVQHLLRWPQREIPTESSIPSPTLPTVAPKGNTDRVFNTKSNTSYGGPKGQYRQSLQCQVDHFLRWPQRAIPTGHSPLVTDTRARVPS